MIHSKKDDRYVGDELQSKDLTEHPDGIFTNDVVMNDEDLEEDERVYNPKPFRDIILHDYTYPGKADTRMGSKSEMLIEAVINITLIDKKEINQAKKVMDKAEFDYMMRSLQGIQKLYDKGTISEGEAKSKIKDTIQDSVKLPSFKKLKM